MNHFSEESRPLRIEQIESRLSTSIPKGSEVEFIILPFFNASQNIEQEASLISDLNKFIELASKDSVVVILTSPFFAVNFCSSSDKFQEFKLWVPVKLSSNIKSTNYIDEQHAALLFFSKNKKGLEHTITRTAYTYCPTCERTTKDYGGKKHLYHEFGTMMPDVWRDITVDFSLYPTDIINRLKDLFGLEKFNLLRVYDERDFYKFSDFKPNRYKVYNDTLSITELESRLIQGDCLDNLNGIRSNSIDFCFADPPYNIKKKYKNWNDGIDIKQYFEWCDKWLSELARVLKPGCTLAVLNIPKWCIRHFKHLNKILDYQDWIVWEGRSLPSKNIVPIHYSILCFSKGAPRTLPGKIRTEATDLEMNAVLTLKEGYCIRESCIKKRKSLKVEDREFATNNWWDIHRLMHNSRRVDHPCQLPPNLMYRLISLFTNKNEIILDPFNGAGTTSLCAQIMDRNYIGIELSEYYHDISQNRHRELQIGLDPFRKNATLSPKVKNSRYERIDKANYKVSKKNLQLEVKDIANKLGRVPSKEEVFAMSKYPCEYFETHFLNWGEALAAVRTTGMSENRKAETLPVEAKF